MGDSTWGGRVTGVDTLLSACFRYSSSEAENRLSATVQTIGTLDLQLFAESAGYTLINLLFQVAGSA